MAGRKMTLLPPVKPRLALIAVSLHHAPHSFASIAF